MPRPKEYDRAEFEKYIALYLVMGLTEADFEHDHTLVCDCHGVRWLSEDVTVDRETGRVTCWDHDAPETTEDRADDAWKERGL